MIYGEKLRSFFKYKRYFPETKALFRYTSGKRMFTLNSSGR